MYFCDRSTEAFERQTPVIRITAELPVWYLEQKYPKRLNTNEIQIWWKFEDIWHNEQIIATWIAKFASVPYSQYLVCWLILTNTVLNIAKISRQHKCNYTQNPWTIPNHRCPMSRTSPVFIKRVQRVEAKQGKSSRMENFRFGEQGRRQNRKCNGES